MAPSGDGEPLLGPTPAQRLDLSQNPPADGFEIDPFVEQLGPLPATTAEDDVNMYPYLYVVLLSPQSEFYKIGCSKQPVRKTLQR